MHFIIWISFVSLSCLICLGPSVKKQNKTKKPKNPYDLLFLTFFKRNQHLYHLQSKVGYLSEHWNMKDSL